MLLMFGWEVVERQQRFPVFDEAFDGFLVLGPELG
jgi:hypothetical protein